MRRAELGQQTLDRHAVSRHQTGCSAGSLGTCRRAVTSPPETLARPITRPASTAAKPFLPQRTRVPLAVSPTQRRAVRGPSPVAATAHTPELIGARHHEQPQVEACDALIVGAGPAGLGTALLLARRKGWERIVILERRPSLDAEEADKSYVYGIDWRGRTLTDEAGVSDAVAAAGVTTYVLNMMQVPPSGDAKSSSLAIKDKDRANTWLPRRAFLRALHGGLAEAEAAGRVTLLHNTKVKYIQLAPPPGAAAADAAAGAAAAEALPPPPPEHPVLVHARDTATGRERLFAPRLLVGADGIHSDVRAGLEAWAAQWGLGGERFRPVVLDSPAAGLRYKVLQLPPNAPFRKPPAGAAAAATAGGEGPADGGQAAGRLDNDKFAVLMGVPAPRRRAMRLGLLPIADPAAPRTANFISHADHELWTLNTGEQLRSFLQASFPQLDIPALFTPQQLDAAAAASGGFFPRPQYLRHFTAVLPPAPAAAATAPASAAAADCGVALVGDAVHCFPPDLGQGVNSAMLDVAGLAQALDETGGDVRRALPLYESRRAPEAAALAHLMTFSYPYQYNQAPLRRALWTVNFLLRGLLSRLLPAVFSPHSFLLVQQPGLSYAEIVKRAHATTARMWALAAAVAAAVLALALRIVSSAAKVAVA